MGTAFFGLNASGIQPFLNQFENSLRILCPYILEIDYFIFHCSPFFTSVCKQMTVIVARSMIAVIAYEISKTSCPYGSQAIYTTDYKKD